MRLLRRARYICIAVLFNNVLLFAKDKPPDNPNAPVCIKCHRNETLRYLATPMGSTLVPQKYPDAVVKHERSGSVVSVTMRDGVMYHKLTENGQTVEYPIRYQVGGGMEGKTFLIQLGDYLFESPVSWFNGFGWDLSPGYATRNVLEFDRAVAKECIFCHATGARFSDPDGKRLATSLQSIGCERCHGSTEAHLQHPSKSNIINPVKLVGPARDSVCEQCHLEGTNRVLNPGKDWTDFQPGEPAENTFTTYSLHGNDKEEIPLASEVEQFAQSRCAQASGGKFWCSACHNPHRPPAPRAQEVRAVCTSCHQKLSPETHAADLKECTSCHMPTINKTTISHASNTDHRILRHPISGSPAAQPEKLVAWREPEEQFRKRNLGIAELLLSSTDNRELWLDGGNLLASLSPETLKTDPEVVSSLQAFYFAIGDSRALEFARRSVELSPQSANAALGLARILQSPGSDSEAEQQFLRAIDLNPSWKEAYGRLAMLYVRQRRVQDAVSILDRYLQWNPNEILFRNWKKQLSSQNPGVTPGPPQ
jgi:predicted CXXCH cytochrome family protein